MQKPLIIELQNKGWNVQPFIIIILGSKGVIHIPVENILKDKLIINKFAMKNKHDNHFFRCNTIPFKLHSQEKKI